MTRSFCETGYRIRRRNSRYGGITDRNIPGKRWEISSKSNITIIRVCERSGIDYVFSVTAHMSLFVRPGIFFVSCFKR